MIFLRSIYVFFTFLLLPCAGLAVTTQIEFLKGSYDCLAAEYKHLSPLHGAVALETGLTQAIYTTGGCTLIEGRDKQARIIMIPETEYPEGDDTATAHLAHLLFHLLNKNFDVSVTQEMQNVLVPKKIGTVIGVLEKLRQESDEKNFEEKFRKAITYKENREASSEFVINAQCFGGGKKAGNALHRFIILIKGSLKECGYFGEQKELPAAKTFAPFTTYTLFLSALCRKMQNKNDLVDYFKAIVRSYDSGKKQDPGTSLIFTRKDGVCLPFQECWRNELFDTSIDKLQMQEQRRKIFEEIEQKKDDREELGAYFFDNFESIVFCEVWDKYHTGDVPPMINYNDDTLFAGRQFIDCGEMAVFNVCNIFLYDPDLGAIKNTEKYGKLHDFYQKYKLSCFDSIDAHNAWAEIVANVPGCVYGQGTNGGKYYIRFDRDNSQDENFMVGSHKLTLVSPSHPKLYELMLDLRSFIIIMDHLFDFGIFKGKDLWGEYKKPNFITQYFTKVIDKFGWTVMSITKLKSIDATEGENLKLADLDVVLDNYTLRFCFKTEKNQNFLLIMTECHSVFASVSEPKSYAMENKLAHFFMHFFTKKAEVCQPIASVYMSLYASFKDCLNEDSDPKIGKMPIDRRYLQFMYLLNSDYIKLHQWKENGDFMEFMEVLAQRSGLKKKDVVADERLPDEQLAQLPAIKEQQQGVALVKQKFVWDLAVSSDAKTKISGLRQIKELIDEHHQDIITNKGIILQALLQNIKNVSNQANELAFDGLGSLLSWNCQANFLGQDEYNKIIDHLIGTAAMYFAWVEDLLLIKFFGYLLNNESLLPEHGMKKIKSLVEKLAENRGNDVAELVNQEARRILKK